MVEVFTSKYSPKSPWLLLGFSQVIYFNYVYITGQGLELAVGMATVALSHYYHYHAFDVKNQKKSHYFLIFAQKFPMLQ